MDILSSEILYYSAIVSGVIGLASILAIKAVVRKYGTYQVPLNARSRAGDER